jgi:hypothetical protein
MFSAGCIRPSAFALPLPSLPTSLIDLIAPDPADHPPCVPGGHSSVRATFGMGGLDCASVHHSHYGERGGDVRHAQDAREPEGTKEEDSAECGDEWRKFLWPPKCNRA